MIHEVLEFPDISYESPEFPDVPRVNEVLSAFRYLQSDAPHRKIIPVTSAFSLKVGQVNVIYGPSGSGKSTVLSKIKEVLGGNDLIDQPENDDFLINLVGSNVREAIQWLTRVGLGEGNLFLRRFSQLSVGQKFRMRLALSLEDIKHDAVATRVLYIDEFGSNLDPHTARAIAHTFSSAVRKCNAVVFVCCNNIDVAAAFDYDAFLSLGLDHISNVQYKNETTRKRPTIYIEKGNVKQYEAFRRHHYLDVGNRINEAELYYARTGTDIIGVTLFVPPLPKEVESLDPYFELINRKMITGYRTVVHPEFRSMGVAKALTIEPPKLAGYEIVEIRSAMYHFAPIPEFWGFVSANQYFDEAYLKDCNANIELRNYIASLGLDPNMMIDDIDCRKVLEAADGDKLSRLIQADEIEQSRNLLSYFCNVMGDCGYPYTGHFDVLFGKVSELTHRPIEESEFIEGIKSQKQPRYGAFYKKIV